MDWKQMLLVSALSFGGGFIFSAIGKWIGNEIALMIEASKKMVSVQILRLIKDKDMQLEVISAALAIQKKMGDEEGKLKFDTLLNVLKARTPGTWDDKIIDAAAVYIYKAFTDQTLLKEVERQIIISKGEQIVLS